MNKIISAAIIAFFVVITVSMLIGFSYLQSEINQQKTQSSNPTTTLTPNPSTEPTPEQSNIITPTPTLKPANLVLSLKLEMVIDSSARPRLKPVGTITNTGGETAYNVTLHIKSWFSNGTQALALDEPLQWNSPTLPFAHNFYIWGDSTYTFGISDYSTYFDVPDYAIGTDWTNASAYSDCISSYTITASWT